MLVVQKKVLIIPLVCYVYIMVSMDILLDNGCSKASLLFYSCVRHWYSLL